jgi:hypothetical protein
MVYHARAHGGWRSDPGDKPYPSPDVNPIGKVCQEQIEREPCFEEGEQSPSAFRPNSLPNVRPGFSQARSRRTPAPHVRTESQENLHDSPTARPPRDFCDFLVVPPLLDGRDDVSGAGEPRDDSS